MNISILKYLIFILVFLPVTAAAQEIWKESFNTPDKGIWGDEDASAIHADFSGITSWSLEYSGIQLITSDDYAKTVSTAGGRFECKDINGEIIWLSEEIDISDYEEVNIKLTASETGSGKNEATKYLNAWLVIDGNEIPFKIHSDNSGNWGKANVEHNNVKGNSIQIKVKMNNHYSADKVILDEIVVEAVDNFPPILAGEVLINEILFNPFPGGSDYLEIYNHSDKVIPLHHLFLASRDKTLELTQVYQLTTKRNLLEPGEYVALTKDTSGVFPWFNIKCPACFLQMPKFPSFNNDEDYVVLLNKNKEIIDELFYTNDLHSPIFADEEGVALERLSFSQSTNSKNNWFSASSISGYGTPGYKNSQTNVEVSKPQISFSPDSFSPNFDGYNDEFKISYQLDKPGYIANAWIFDATGRKILQLANNEILGTIGAMTWTGKDEFGKKQNMGVYIALLEIFDTEGNVYKFKNGLVLTGVVE